MDLKIRVLRGEDLYSEFPQFYNENMQVIEQALMDLEWEIKRLRDDIEQLKILARED